MKIIDIISEENIFFNLDVVSKKVLFERIAEKIFEKTKIDKNLILKKLNEREKLGTTSLGNGVAIPHMKIEGIDEVFSIFLQLKKSINFSSDDLKDVELVFVIIAPSESQTKHLLALSTISKFLKKKNMINKLLKTSNSKQTYKLMEESNED